MASRGEAPGSSGGLKRTRDGEDERQELHEPQRKHVRPTLASNEDLERWQQGSASNTPTAPGRAFLHPIYDSDEHSSMVSEPRSPQDMSMSSDGDERRETDGASPSKPDGASGSPWGERLQSRRRVPTPFGTMTSAIRPTMSIRTGVQQHIRQRHPQENVSSDHLDVPSPIDEDEVPTPPSAAAAEAAGSQLSMLSVNDMDMDATEPLPTITVDLPRGLQTPDGRGTPDFESMDSRMETVVVRKQRQRSGAQSNGSVSPARKAGMEEEVGGVGGKRGFSMGFRADCEKCQMRVPGHMNHFVL